MIKKKICMLGAFATGKTSLVQRFVKSIFSEKYHTTVGVKIDKKNVTVDNKEVDLMLWDIHGEDEYQKVKSSYLRGMAGYFLVIDRTREYTLETAFLLQERAENAVGKVPFILVFNKSDLQDDWEIDETTIEELTSRGYTVAKTSAKTGQGVEDIFVSLTKKILED